MTLWTDHTRDYWGAMTPPCRVTQARFGLLTVQVLQDAYGHYICHCLSVWRERRLDATSMEAAQREACRELKKMVQEALQAIADEAKGLSRTPMTMQEVKEYVENSLGWKVG